MIKIDENDPVGEIEPSFPYRDVKIKKDTDVKRFYDLQKEIGRGKFGTVYKCRERTTGLKLAAKFINISKRQDRRNAEREVEIMKELQHPRLIQLYDAYEMNNIMCVVLELIEGGELFERVIDDDFILTEKSVSVFMRQICEGVAFIHSKNILHLDLKPENILCLTRDGNRIKIIDFGLARKYDPEKKLQVLFGTPEFVAPEVVNFDSIGFGTDMWSVGVICYVLISGLSPFMGETDVQTMANVTIAQYDFDDEAFNDISKDAQDFISKLLVKDREERMSATECLSHPWLRQRKPVLQTANDSCITQTNNELDFQKDVLRNIVDRWNGDSNVLAITPSDSADKNHSVQLPTTNGAADKKPKSAAAKTGADKKKTKTPNPPKPKKSTKTSRKSLKHESADTGNAETNNCAGLNDGGEHDQKFEKSSPSPNNDRRSLKSNNLSIPDNADHIASSKKSSEKTADTRNGKKMSNERDSTDDQMVSSKDTNESKMLEIQPKSITATTLTTVSNPEKSLDKSLRKTKDTKLKIADEMSITGRTESKITENFEKNDRNLESRLSSAIPQNVSAIENFITTSQTNESAKISEANETLASERAKFFLEKSTIGDFKLKSNSSTIPNNVKIVEPRQGTIGSDSKTNTKTFAKVALKQTTKSKPSEDTDSIGSAGGNFPAQNTNNTIERNVSNSCRKVEVKTNSSTEEVKNERREILNNVIENGFENDKTNNAKGINVNDDNAETGHLGVMKNSKKSTKKDDAIDVRKSKDQKPSSSESAVSQTAKKVEVEVDDSSYRCVKRRNVFIKNIVENYEQKNKKVQKEVRPDKESDARTSNEADDTLSTFATALLDRPQLTRRRISDISSLLSRDDGLDKSIEEMAAFCNNINQIRRLRSDSCPKSESESTSKRPKFRLSCFSRDVPTFVSAPSYRSNLLNYLPWCGGGGGGDENSFTWTFKKPTSQNHSDPGSLRNSPERLATPSLTRKILSKFFDNADEYCLDDFDSTSRNLTKEKLTEIFS